MAKDFFDTEFSYIVNGKFPDDKLVVVVVKNGLSFAFIHKNDLLDEMNQAIDRVEKKNG